MKRDLRQIICLGLVLILLCLSFSACKNPSKTDPPLGSDNLGSNSSASVKPIDGNSVFYDITIDNLSEDEPEEEDLLQASTKNYNLYGYHVIKSPYINAKDIKRIPILDETCYCQSQPGVSLALQRA